MFKNIIPIAVFFLVIVAVIAVASAAASWAFRPYVPEVIEAVENAADDTSLMDSVLASRSTPAASPEEDRGISWGWVVVVAVLAMLKFGAPFFQQLRLLLKKPRRSRQQQPVAPWLTMLPANTQQQSEVPPSRRLEGGSDWVQQ